MKSGTNTFRETLVRGAVIFNPVLIQLAGICAVAAVSTGVAESVFFTIIFAADTIISCFLASAIMKKLPRWFRVALYMLIGTAVVCGLYYPAGMMGLTGGRVRIYLPLLAANSVTAVHCEQFAVRHKVKEAVWDALAVSLGFGAVIILLGIIREFFGSMSFAGIPLPFDISLPGMLMPFGGFIVLGFMAMILKWYINRFKPEYNEETSVKIKEQKVGLRDKGEAPEEAAGEEALTEMEFLFGGEPEEVEIFTEFWIPPEITAEAVTEDMEANAEEHRRRSEDTERRVDEVINSFEIDELFADITEEFEAQLSGLTPAADVPPETETGEETAESAQNTPEGTDSDESDNGKESED